MFSKKTTTVDMFVLFVPVPARNWTFRVWYFTEQKGGNFRSATHELKSIAIYWQRKHVLYTLNPSENKWKGKNVI